jgi:hypothetical protein
LTGFVTFIARISASTNAFKRHGQRHETPTQYVAVRISIKRRVNSPSSLVQPTEGETTR